MLQIDDLWLASYLITQGADLAGVRILPYNSGGSRMRAVFELEGVADRALEEYGSGDPLVAVHQLRTHMNRLRDLMYAELEKRNGNGSIKAMPNGQRSAGNNGGGQRRRGEYENRSRHHR